MVESREQGDVLSGFIKFREFLNQLSDCQLLKMDSAPGSLAILIETE